MNTTNSLFSATTFINGLRDMYPNTSMMNLQNHAEHLMGEYYPTFIELAYKEMKESVYEELLKRADVDGFNDADTINFVYMKIENICNPFDTLENNANDVISDILHDCVGFIGKNLTDSEFEEFHGWFDENYSLFEMLPIAISCYNDGSFIAFHDVFEKFCFINGYNTNMFLKNNVTNMTENDIKRKYTEVCSLNLSREVTEMMFSIINTADYDGDMNVIVVKGITPVILKNYGFDDDECKEIGELKVGDTWVNSCYGNGVVVVRIA